MRLILIRHAETIWNAERRWQGQIDTELSENGKEQTRLLAESLKDTVIDAVYSSPLKRALYTAETITSYHNLPVVLDNGLMEQNLGEFEGHTIPEMQRDHSDALIQWLENPLDFRPPQGETLFELQTRAWQAIEQILHSHAEHKDENKEMGWGDTVIAVSHNLTILTIICKILCMELSNFRRFRQFPTAKNIIEFDGENKGTLILFNDRCHLNQNSKIKT